MNAFLEGCLKNNRTVFACLFFFVIGGMFAFYNMPREATPDIDIPVIYVVVTQEGISPEDAERLLIKPLEKELKSIEGVKEMTAQSTEGMASVTLEFQANFDKKTALEDVRAAVQLAEGKLPPDAKKPNIHEVSFSQFPVLIVGLSGDIPENALIKIARDLKSRIEGISSVLAVEIGADREDLVELRIKPELFNFYDLQFSQVLPLVSQNNKLVSSGTWDVGSGRMPFNVPGIYKNLEDIYNTPLKVHEDSLVKMGDVVNLHKTYKDPESLARINGHSTKALYIKKRSGENIIETVKAIKTLIAKHQPYLPSTLRISYMQDESTHIADMLRDLQNNLIVAMILVMLVVGFSLGPRSTFLVGISVPGSFLMGLFILYLGGVTINNVVLFSLILAIGMLVDAAIIVTEFADRKMTEGMPRYNAYLLASQRMILPVLGSTLTTIAAFLPMLFWPGVVGKFMRYLPITVNCILGASLVMALIFIPTLGALIGKPGTKDIKAIENLKLAETGDILSLGGWTGYYVKLLKTVLEKPFRVLISTMVAFILVIIATILFGKGVEFFPSVEPDRINAYVRIRGDFSIYELEKSVLQVESCILPIVGIKNVYTKVVANSSNSQNGIADAHGILEIEFTDWQQRPKAVKIIEQIKSKTKYLPGIIVEVRQEQAGPRGLSKPIEIQVSSILPDLVVPNLEKILHKMQKTEGLIDISDSRPPPGIEWTTTVDRAKASIFGADIAFVGNMVRLLTNGLLLAKYRPDDSEDEVDISLRYPPSDRHYQQWQRLYVYTPKGSVPISHFVSFAPTLKVSSIQRAQGERTLSAYADTLPHILPNDKIKELKAWLAKENPIDEAVTVQFKGEDEDQKESGSFLMQAFCVALGLISIILIAQFNSYYYTFLILTAVVFSTIGVMLGLLLTFQPFSIIMNGIGIVSLAGIVVNNNIVLIDTYIFLKASGMPVIEAVLRTGAQRLRPVFLTTATTILGVLPMALGLNINFIGSGEGFITIGDPSTQWWKQLAISIAFGLAFATFLTLILTPAMLVLGNNCTQTFQKKYLRKILSWISR